MPEKKPGKMRKFTTKSLSIRTAFNGGSAPETGMYVYTRYQVILYCTLVQYTYHRLQKGNSS